jgi:hypothetical protein
MDSEDRDAGAAAVFRSEERALDGAVDESEPSGRLGRTNSYVR